MIYLDNAATTWPKPPQVEQMMGEALRRYGANPGRGGHPMAMKTAERVYACRELLADTFGLDDPTRVVFTANCTGALNAVIKGLLAEGGHAVISDMEHNSVVRPLEVLSVRGVTYTKVNVCEADEDRTVENFSSAVRPDTRLILCTHASNVFGTIVPIQKIGQLARQLGIPFAVDAAQSAGILPIHMETDGIDYLCMPGHKGLYGPMGTGVLLCRDNRPLYTVTEGGTGSVSLSAEQPKELPDRLESGTLNVPGICGLYGGVCQVRQWGLRQICCHEQYLMKRLYETIAHHPNIVVYTPYPNDGKTVPIVSLNVVGIPAEETAARLSDEGVAVRAGLHCAPSAHAHAGTLPYGTVRISPSMFTSEKEIKKVCELLIKISRNPCNKRIVWYNKSV